MVNILKVEIVQKLFIKYCVFVMIVGIVGLYIGMFVLVTLMMAKDRIQDSRTVFSSIFCHNLSEILHVIWWFAFAQNL